MNLSVMPPVGNIFPRQCLASMLCHFIRRGGGGWGVVLHTFLAVYVVLKNKYSTYGIEEYCTSPSCTVYVGYVCALLKQTYRACLKIVQL